MKATPFARCMSEREVPLWLDKCSKALYGRDGTPLRKEYGDTRGLTQLLLGLNFALLQKDRRAAPYLQGVLAVALERTNSFPKDRLCHV